MKNLTDEQVVILLESSDRHENDRALSFLYQQHFRMLESFVLKHSGSNADAEDVFQDCLIVLYNQVKSGEFELRASIGTYLYAIAKNVWYKKFRTTNKETVLGETHEDIPVDENHLSVIEENEKSNAIAQMMKHLDEKCRRLLLLFYYERQRMKYIADEMGWGSEQVAKNQKAQCMRKLKDMLKKNPSLNIDLR